MAVPKSVGRGGMGRLVGCESAVLSRRAGLRLASVIFLLLLLLLLIHAFS